MLVEHKDIQMVDLKSQYALIKPLIDDAIMFLKEKIG